MTDRVAPAAAIGATDSTTDPRTRSPSRRAGSTARWPRRLRRAGCSTSSAPIPPQQPTSAEAAPTAEVASPAEEPVASTEAAEPDAADETIEPAAERVMMEDADAAPAKAEAAEPADAEAEAAPAEAEVASAEAAPADAEDIPAEAEVESPAPQTRPWRRTNRPPTGAARRGGEGLAHRSGRRAAHHATDRGGPAGPPRVVQARRQPPDHGRRRWVTDEPNAVL